MKTTCLLLLLILAGCNHNDEPKTLVFSGERLSKLKSIDLPPNTESVVLFATDRHITVFTTVVGDFPPKLKVLKTYTRSDHEFAGLVRVVRGGF